MKYIFCWLLLVLFVTVNLKANVLLLTQEQKEYIVKNPTIKVSNELNWPPYDFYEHGHANGYAVDLLEFLAHSVGLNVEFVTGSWVNLNKKFISKEIDILYPARKTKKREDIALFSKKFIQMRASLITKLNTDDIKSLEDMKGKTLALVKGWSSAQYIKDNYKGIKYKDFDTSKDMLEAVAFGLADGAIEDFFTANYIIKEEMLSNLYVTSKVFVNDKTTYSLHLMFQKDNQILQSIFDIALANIKEEEVLKMKTKWLDEFNQKKQNIVLNNDEKNYLKKKKVIKMCIDPDWMPLEMLQNGLHVGMASDYIKLIEEGISTPIELVQTNTWIDSIEFAKSRKCDILSLVMSTPDRKLYMNFTKSYLNIPIVLVSTLDTAFYSDVGSITDKNIGIVKGYAYGEILRVKYPHMKLVEVKNISDGLKKVENKELFGFIGALATVAYKMQREYFGSLKIVGKFDQAWELGVGVRNDEPLLLSSIEKAIDLIDDSEHQKIFNKWISVQYDRKIDYTHLFQFLFIVFLFFIFMFYRQYQLEKYNKKLEKLSSTDKLTGIYNRLKLDDVIDHEKNLFDRFARPLSIIIFDIDDFKKVNDKYGHKKGDEILQKVSKIILKSKRKTDILGRWGGEEFLIICHETNLNGSKMLAEKFRKIIYTHNFNLDSKLSASFGIAEFKKSESTDRVFIRADDGLYKAKKLGKNRVEYV